jgi:hypothetical protein
LSLESLSVGVGHLLRDREVLIEACVEVADAVPSVALRAQLLDALEAAGVSAVDVAANTRFDPAQHRASDSRATDRPDLDGLVVQTERLGFVDRGRRLRFPDVVVYRSLRRAGGA